MRKARMVLGVAVTMLICPLSVGGQGNPTPTVKIEELMTSDELRTTGVGLALARFRRQFAYAAWVARAFSNAAGLTCPSVECRRRWL